MYLAPLPDPRYEANGILFSLYLIEIGFQNKFN
jgi:hypothetical protein